MADKSIRVDDALAGLYKLDTVITMITRFRTDMDESGRLDLDDQAAHIDRSLTSLHSARCALAEAVPGSGLTPMLARPDRYGPLEP